MARVTVEESLEKVRNRFELVVLISERARRIALGSPSCVPKKNDKHVVTALREFEADLLSIEEMKSLVIKRNQKRQLVGNIGISDYSSGNAASDEEEKEVVFSKENEDCSKNKEQGESMGMFSQYEDQEEAKVE